MKKCLDKNKIPKGDNGDLQVKGDSNKYCICMNIDSSAKQAGQLFQICIM